MRTTLLCLLFLLTATARGKDDPVPGFTNVQLWTCNGGFRQQWKIVQKGPPNDHIQLKINGRVLDIANYRNDTGANVQVFGPSKTPWNEQFTYNATSGEIVSLMNGKCVAAAPSTNFSGANVEMWPCSGSVEQSFVYNATDETIRSKANDELCLDAGDSVNCTIAPYNTYAYCNYTLDAETRAKDLVSRLKLIEKIQNMQNKNPGVPRLGVPQFKFGECLHGVRSRCGTAASGSTGCPTSFPHALGLAATFNHTLWSLAGETVSTEARALHNQGVTGIAFWAPDVNLFKDPRWGRGQEVPGEDPFLTAEYVAHYSTGLQSMNNGRYLKVVSACKHFSAYDLEHWNGTGRMDFNAIVSDQDLVEYYFVPFRSCVERAHVQGIMCSYNAVNGIPSCANSLYQNTIARGEWGFDGFIVSDCSAISVIQNRHHYTNNSNDTCKAGLLGGCDLNCGSFYNTYLLDAVNGGFVPQAAVDEALFRIYREFFRLGEMDPPEMVPYKSLGPESVDTPASRQLAYEAAQQMIVLLKNDDNLLPLDQRKIHALAVIGPHANATQDLLSNYHGTNTLVDSHSPLQALTALLGAQRIKYAQGCNIDDNDTSLIDAAATAAASSDVAVVFVGLHQTQEREGLDRTTLDLPGAQTQLIQKVVATKKPTVVVLINGGPLAIEWVAQHVPAIVEAFYPGEMGGDAIADVLLGKVNPAGRLPYTIYPSDFVSKRSMFDMSLRDNGGITYRHYTGKPLWEFGFGLSYTTFNYTWDSSTRLHSTFTTEDALNVHDSPIQYTVTVKNTGSVAGSDAVLAFLTNDLTAYPDAPLKELYGFSRVFLQPGESTTVHLSVPPSVVSQVDKRGVEAILPGLYGVQIGGLRAQFELVGNKQVTFDMDVLKRSHF